MHFVLNALNIANGCMYTTYLIQNYLRTCSVLIVMVLALGVMVEEAADNGWVHSLVDGAFCNTHLEDLQSGQTEDNEHYQTHKKTCEAFRKADKWYYVMLFTADIVLVLSVIALFAIFAQWMLFAVLVSHPVYQRCRCRYHPVLIG